MGPLPADTYNSIPPPPLPEFYTSTTSRRAHPMTPSETTVYSKPIASSGRVADDRWHYVDVKKTTATPKAHASPDHDHVPPLAVYHICRICLRPRSARYHRDHPIPADGVPPPPGICRRCRVAPADDLKAVAELSEHDESNTIRIGVGSLVPDEDYLSNSDAHEKRSRRRMSTTSWKEMGERTYRPSHTTKPVSSLPRKEREQIIYRHIHMMPSPPMELRSPVRPEVTPASTAQDAIDANRAWEQAERRAERKTECGAFEAFNAGALEAVREHQNKIDASSAQATAGSTPRATTISIPPPPPSDARSASPRGSISSRRHPEDFTEAATFKHSLSEAFADAVTGNASRPAHLRSNSPTRAHARGRSEAEIRRLARDEVERYRHAERRLERHASPYAHGRMVEVTKVPVERRIDVVKDTPAEMPWAESQEFKRKDSRLAPQREVEVLVERRYSNRPAKRDVCRKLPASSAGEVHWRCGPQDSNASYQDGTKDQNTQRISMIIEGQGQRSVKAEQSVPARVKELRETFDRQERKEYDVLSHTRRVEKEEEPGQYERSKRSVVVTSHRPHAESLPYPEDEEGTVVTMPSPSTHASRKARPTKQADAGTDRDEGEYEYVTRKKHSYSRSPTRGRYGEYESTTTTYVHRTKPAADRPSGEPSTSEARDRRPSDASSRVHFSKKVDISPTPPGSNASSREFRDFSRRKEEPRERGEDLIAEYEHRGRLRSRDPYFDDDRDRTPRPGQNQRESDETSGIKPWVRALSESPSRELSTDFNRRMRGSDVSMSVEDGSTASSDSLTTVERVNRRRDRLGER